MKRLLLAICLAGFASMLTAQETLKVGDKAPDFEVASFDDATIKLSERFGDSGKPTILLFSRANW